MIVEIILLILFVITFIDDILLRINKIKQDSLLRDYERLLFKKDILNN